MPHVLYIGSQLFVAREFVICRLSFSSVGPTNMTCGRGASKTIKSIVSFLGGIIFTLVVLAVVGYFAVKGGRVPTNADSKPAALESWVANTALEAALKRDTEGLRNPIQPSDENLISGVQPVRRKLRDMPWRIGRRAFEPGSRLLYRGTAACQRWSRR
jgi:hypothetical protein